MTDVKLLIDQLGDAPFPNAQVMAREAYLQQTMTQIVRLLLARIEALEAEVGSASPVRHIPAPYV